MPCSPRSLLRIAFLLATVLPLLVLAACGDDDGDQLAAPQSGTIEIATTPVLDAPWSLAGPDALAEQGTGAQELTSMPPGDYTLTWGAVDGWVTPQPQTGALAAGEVRRFTGTYTEALLGAIAVTTLPDTLSGPWQITGPAGFQAAGTGSEVIADLEPGLYEIEWERLPLWLGPAPLQMQVAAAETTGFLGQYERITGVLPDWVMWLFEDSHDIEAADAYAGMLSEDFLFIPQDGDPYGYDAEVATMSRIFAGQQGQFGYAVSDVEVVTLQPQGVWEAVPASEPDFGGLTGVQKRTYLIQIDFGLAGQFLILRVEGPAVFYVREETDLTGSQWKLLGIRDATFGGKGVESTTWTHVKAYFQ